MCAGKAEARESLLKARLSTFDLLVLTSSDQLILIEKNSGFTKQAILTRRSIVPSLPVQYGFPVGAYPTGAPYWANIFS